MSQQRTMEGLSDGEQIRVRLELLIRSTVEVARDNHRHAMAHRRFGAERWQVEIEQGFALRQDAMQTARQFRWALTGKDSLTERRRTARFDALRAAVARPPQSLAA